MLSSGDRTTRDVNLSPASGFPIMSDTNRPVQSQKQARGLKFWIEVEEELYYPSSENKGTCQLRSYCEPDLRICFRIDKNPVFSRCSSNCNQGNCHCNSLWEINISHLSIA